MSEIQLVPIVTITYHELTTDAGGFEITGIRPVQMDIRVDRLTGVSRPKEVAQCIHDGWVATNSFIELPRRGHLSYIKQWTIEIIGTGEKTFTFYSEQAAAVAFEILHGALSYALGSAN